MPHVPPPNFLLHSHPCKYTALVASSGARAGVAATRSIYGEPVEELIAQLMMHSSKMNAQKALAPPASSTLGPRGRGVQPMGDRAVAPRPPMDLNIGPAQNIQSKPPVDLNIGPARNIKHPMDLDIGPAKLQSALSRPTEAQPARMQRVGDLQMQVVPLDEYGYTQWPKGDARRAGRINPDKYDYSLGTGDYDPRLLTEKGSVDVALGSLNKLGPAWMNFAEAARRGAGDALKPEKSPAPQRDLVYRGERTTPEEAPAYTESGVPVWPKDQAGIEQRGYEGRDVPGPYDPTPAGDAVLQDRYNPWLKEADKLGGELTDEFFSDKNITDPTTKKNIRKGVMELQKRRRNDFSGGTTST